MKIEVERWNEMRRRQKKYQDLKAAYDAAEGSFADRCYAAALALNIAYIDATWMMGAWRDGSGVVTPRPANFDPVRDAPRRVNSRQST